MSDSPTSREAPWAAGLRGARANLVPGLILQALALALVVSYYRSQTAREALEHLTTLRQAWGIVFPILTTGLCGGVLPLLVLWSSPATRQVYTVGQGAALTAFWAYKGFEIDLWYRFQAGLFGAGAEPTTIVLKMILDQFIWCPIWAIPSTVVIYGWITHHFDARPVWQDLRTPGWYLRSVLPVLLSNLGVWVPAVCIIYALPTPLQLPFQNVILTFFTLMVAHMTRKRH